jgi:hypothetical protein
MWCHSLPSHRPNATISGFVYGRDVDRDADRDADHDVVLMLAMVLSSPGCVLARVDPQQ